MKPEECFLAVWGLSPGLRLPVCVPGAPRSGPAEPCPNSTFKVLRDFHTFRSGRTSVPSQQRCTGTSCVDCLLPEGKSYLS